MNRDQQIQNTLAIKIAELHLEIAQLQADVQAERIRNDELQNQINEKREEDDEC